MTMGEKAAGKKSDLEIQANEALSELKDWTILLDMAGEYLCAEPFLKKMGSAVSSTCDVLKNWAQELKKRFVGKPMHEIDTAQAFQDLVHFSERLQGTEEKLEDRCKQGKIARELEEKVQFLKELLGSLKERVEGETAPYTAKDTLKRVLEKLKIVVHGLVTTYKVATRIVAILFLVCIISFFALFLTMDKVEDVQREIHRIQDTIQAKETRLAGVDARLEKIRSRALEMESRYVSRDDKISILELNLRSHKLVDKK